VSNSLEFKNEKLSNKEKVLKVAEVLASKS
jgi:hypothetical protein